jgi:hypothetical protein
MGCQTCYLKRFPTHVAARPLLSAVVIELPCGDRGEAVVSMSVAEHATVMTSAARPKTTAGQVVATFGDPQLRQRRAARCRVGRTGRRKDRVELLAVQPVRAIDLRPVLARCR